MSTLKLTGSSSGSTSLQAPSSGSDRVITFPDSAGTVALTGEGITHAEQWRVNSNFTAAAEPIENNWERVDGTGQGGIGTNFSAPSSGIWTFPSTGIWWVHCQLGFGHTADIQWIQLDIKATTNNSSYTTIANGWASIGDVASTFYSHVKADTFIDCTDTANVKFSLGVQNQANPTYQGYTNTNACYATFIRLGDT